MPSKDSTVGTLRLNSVMSPLRISSFCLDSIRVSLIYIVDAGLSTLVSLIICLSRADATGTLLTV